MVTILPSICYCSNPLSNDLVIVPSAPIIIGTTVTRIVNKVYVLVDLYTFFYFNAVVCLNSKIHYTASSLFFFFFFFFVYH